MGEAKRRAGQPQRDPPPRLVLSRLLYRKDLEVAVQEQWAWLCAERRQAAKPAPGLSDFKVSLLRAGLLEFRRSRADHESSERLVKLPGEV